VVLRRRPRAPGAPAFPRSLDFPVPFAGADSVTRDESGVVKYHYAIVEVAATVDHPDKVPVPGDDADDARWFPIRALRELGPEVVELCADLAEEAAARFDPS
jgi:8-oxo-dGTP diphosphatase